MKKRGTGNHAGSFYFSEPRPPLTGLGIWRELSGMTPERAVYLLRRYREEEILKPTKRLFGYRLNYDFKRASYERSLVNEIIFLITANGRDPIGVIQNMYYAFDEVVCESGNPKTWAFASLMENCCGDIAEYLRKYDTDENEGRK